MAGPFTAGQRITAAQLNAFCAPVEVIKAADQSVTSSTVLVNDTALVLPVVASATYDFSCYLDYEGGTLGASDLKFQWTVPSGTLRFWMGFVNTAGTNSAGQTFTDTSVVGIGTNGAASLRGAQMEGSLVVGSTGGSLQLQWAQNMSSATATIVHAQSRVRLWRIT
jgi:hypothetical protein